MAFMQCPSLKLIYCPAQTPPALGVDAFLNNSAGRKIHVPTSSVNAYKSATNWKDYANDIVDSL